MNQGSAGNVGSERLGRQGHWLPGACHLLEDALCCFCLRVTPHSVCLLKAKLMHSGAKGSFQPPLGLGWASDKSTQPSIRLLPHHHPSWSCHVPAHAHAYPHTHRLAHPVIQGQKHFNTGLKSQRPLL